MTYHIKISKYVNNQVSVIGWRSRNRVRREEESALSDSVSSLLERDLASASPGLDPPLDINNKLKTEAIKCAAHSFRRTVFGKNARTRLIHAGAACDLIDPLPQNYLFITATLPGDDIWCKWAIAEYASEIINRLKAWLSKRMSNRLEFYVWEHQKRGALHLHYCVHVPDVGIREKIKAEFATEWIRLINRVGDDVGHSLWGRHSEKPFNEKLALVQTKVEQVKFSVGAYLAGYVAGKGDKHGKDKYYDFYPRRWWGVSRPLCKVIEENTSSTEHVFSRKASWEEQWEKIDSKFECHSLTRKFYKHKIGEGKSLIFYYSPEEHSQICLQKTMLKFNQSSQPKLYSLIQKVTVAHRSGAYIVRSSPKLRAKLSPQLVDYLEDVTWLNSLTRSTLSQTHILINQKMHIEFGSILLYVERYEGFLEQLREAELEIARAWSQLKWNKYGWLEMTEDLKELDKTA